jgi:hypothetical protein
MAAQNGAVQVVPSTTSNRVPVETVAAFLLRVEAQEQAGLARRSAVLAAGVEFGIDPAAILQRAVKVAD